MKIILLNILYILMILLFIIARIKNVCEKNEKDEILGDVIQIIILSLGLHYLLGIVTIFKLALLIIFSIFIKYLIDFFYKKIFKGKIKYSTENCSDCNPYKKWGK